MQTVQAFLEGFLVKWETAKHSLDPDDSGNYFKGALVGSKYGVTGKALAEHRGLKSVTKDDIASVTLAEAANIARTVYYDEANFDLLPWGPVVASAVDKCYLSGPTAAVACFQRAAGVADDGVIGPMTINAAAAYAGKPDVFAREFAKQRSVHEERVIKAKPEKAKYRKGWTNRANSYLPGTAWWKAFGVEAVAEPVAEVSSSFDLVLPEPTRGFPVSGTTAPNTKPSPELGSLYPDTVSETAQANITELAKSLPRADVTAVLAANPAGIGEHALEATKLKLKEKSTWIGAAIAVGSVVADPTVQAALKPAWQAVQHGSWGGILSAVIGLGLIVAKSSKSPRADAVLAAKRIIG